MLLMLFGVDSYHGMLPLWSYFESTEEFKNAIRELFPTNKEEISSYDIVEEVPS